MNLIHRFLKVRMCICFASAYMLLHMTIPVSAVAPSNSDEFMFLDRNDMQWQKSPNGYSVAFGKLWIFKPNGDAVSLACNFYRDRPGDKLAYGEVGGFRLEAGSWTPIQSKPNQLLLRLRLIDSDKMSKPVHEQGKQTYIRTTMKILFAKALEKATTIQDDQGKKFDRIFQLKNQTEFNKMLTGLKSTILP